MVLKWFIGVPKLRPSKQNARRRTLKSMDGELVMVPGATLPQMIPKAASDEIPAKRKPVKKWFKHWVTQDTVLSPGKCQFLKWINEDTMNMIKSKHIDCDEDSDYEAVYVCTFDNCGKVFTEAPALRKHAHVHGEKQYICHYEGCGKRFVDSSKLKRHFLIHTGEKHYVCKFCGKAFSLDFNLRSHMRTHTGENYHTCPYEDCGKRYAHEYKLRGHLRTHHDRVLPDGRQLEPDTAKASPTASSAGRPFVCPYEGCDKRYFYEYKLNLHLKRSHAKDELIEDVAHNGSDEFSEGSDEHAPKAARKGKLRIMTQGPTKTSTSSSRKRKPPAPKLPAAATSISRAQAAPPPPPAPSVAVPIIDGTIFPVKRKKSNKPDDSEETEDEAREDMDEDGPPVFDDEEETEDDGE